MCASTLILLFLQSESSKSSTTIREQKHKKGFKTLYFYKKLKLKTLTF